MGEEVETSFEPGKEARSVDAKPSVAMVLNKFSERGGLELYTHKLVEGLTASGYAVTVFCQEKDSDFVHPNLQVAQFASPPKSSAKADRIAIASKNAAQMVRERGPFDIVHSQHFLLDELDVVTFHNHTVYRLSDCGLNWEKLLNQFKLAMMPAYKMRAHVDGVLIGSSKILIFPSKLCQADFETHYQISKNHDKPSLMVAHPGATLPHTDPPIGAGKLDGEPFTFLFVGRGYRKKGLDILLDAVRILKARKLRFKLLVAGLRFKPIDRVRLKRRGIDGIVDYLGFRSDMDNVYAQASAIVLPSRVEPFGMAPVEGMLRGLVPIVSKVCGVAETLTHEKNALIFQDHLSARELADCMARLITDKKLTEKLSGDARQKALELDWQHALEVTEKAYLAVQSHRKNVISSSSKGAHLV